MVYDCLPHSVVLLRSVTLPRTLGTRIEMDACPCPKELRCNLPCAGDGHASISPPNPSPHRLSLSLLTSMGGYVHARTPTLAGVAAGAQNPFESRATTTASPCMLCLTKGPYQNARTLVNCERDPYKNARTLRKIRIKMRVLYGGRSSTGNTGFKVVDAVPRAFIVML